MLERRPETTSTGSRAWRLGEWMSRVFDIVFPWLAVVVFAVLVIGAFLVLALLGLAIVGTAHASLNMAPLLRLRPPGA